MFCEPPASASRARRPAAPPAPRPLIAGRTSASTVSAARARAPSACYTCATSGNGQVHGGDTGRYRLERDDEVRGAELLHGAARVHVGQEAERRDLHHGQRLRLELLRGRHLLRKLVLGSEQPCKSCKNATGTCTFAAVGTDLHSDCKGEMRSAAGRATARGRARWAPAGKQCRHAGLPGRPRAHHQRECDLRRRRQLPGHGADGLQRLRLLHRYAMAARSARRIARPIPTARSGATARSSPTVAPPTAGTTSTCPTQFPLGHACTRNPQCLSGTCAIPLGGSIGVCCNTACDHCGTLRQHRHLHPRSGRARSSATCADSASDPTRKCGGMCDGHAHCQYPAAGTRAAAPARPAMASASATRCRWTTTPAARLTATG